MTPWKRMLVAVASWMLAGDGREKGRLRRWLAGLFLHYFPGQITCAEFEAFLIDYHEGALSERQRALFDFHLSICPMCQVQFASYLRTIELGRRVFTEGEEPVPGEVEEELVNAILSARSQS